MKLDLSIDLSIDLTDVSGSFERIAEELMNHWILEVNHLKYRIAEIEFYLKNSQHNDNYTHGHELQKTTGNWYFHGSGLDLTFGNHDSFGSILIRAIYNIENHKYIYGPLKTVTEIFSNLGTAYSAPIHFGLLHDTNKILNSKPVLKAPRVGLNPDKDKENFDKLYRFFIMPKEEHKDKTVIYNSLISQGFSEEEARIIWK